MSSKRALFPIGVFQFISFLRRAIFYAFFYLYLRTFLGLPNTLAALLGTANLLASTFGQLRLWGPRLNNQPSLAKKYVVWGNVIAAITYFIVFIGHSIFLDVGSKLGSAIFIIILLSLLEIFWSMSDLGIRYLISQATEGVQRGQLVGLVDGIGLVGQIIGFLISGYLYEDGKGFRNGTIFSIVIVLILFCALAILVSPEVEKKSLEKNTTPKKFRELFSIRSYIIFIVILMILVIGISSSNQIFLYYSEDPSSLHFSDQQISYLLILFSLVGGIIAPLSGRVSDNVGRIPIVITGSFIASISYILLFFLGNQPFLVIAVFYSLIGAGFSIIQSVSFAHTADLLPRELRGTGFALFNITLGLGWGVAGFIIGGPVADLLIFLGYPIQLAYRFSFLVSGTMIFFGMMILTFYSRTQNRNPRSSGTQIGNS
ncbi:MAG: MFS transporter [Candidatus Hodarchaeales archaeon]|jgi:MFS family permease